MLAKPLGVLRLQLRTLRVRVPRTVVCLDGAVLLLENDPEGKRGRPTASPPSKHGAPPEAPVYSARTP